MRSTTRPAPRTEQEKKEALAMALGQKREEFAKNILYRLFHSGKVRNPKKAVATAVEAADALMDALYKIEK